MWPFRSRKTRTSDSASPAVVLVHDKIGTIVKQPNSPFDGEATVSYRGRDIVISIDRDDQRLKASVEIAAELAGRLEGFDALAKQLAVRDLRDDYNNGWNEYEESQADGSFKTVIKPTLSETEFSANLTLTNVTVIGQQCIDMFYDDNKMFWGHSILITSLNGLDFKDAQAQMHG